MKSTLSLLLLLLVGCSPSPEEARSINQGVLKTNGDAIGRLPDGREVIRYTVWDGGGSRVHTLYVVNGSISINHVVQVGKTSYVATEVVIDGVTYVPKTP